MITGVSNKPMPYVPESERTATEMQTVVWIKAKTAADSNRMLAEYAGAGRDGRKGYRDLNTRKLDNADINQFLAVVAKWEWYQFSDRFPELAKQGPLESVTDEATLTKICMDISSDLLIEIFEASNDISQLTTGQKKD